MPPLVGPQDVSPLMTVLQERWVLTLATSPRPADPHALAGVPYPTPLFYAVADAGVAAGGPRLLFASRADSTHGRHLGEGPTAVAAGLYCESEVVGELRGVQLQGEVSPLDQFSAPAAAELRAIYLARHPVAAALLKPGARDRLYVLTVMWAKLTDNRLGFGHKLEWRFAASGPRESFEHPPRPGV
jgi:uncharacterized protein YhbP (UPF0306 family)